MGASLRHLPLHTTADTIVYVHWKLVPPRSSLQVSPGVVRCVVRSHMQPQWARRTYSMPSDGGWTTRTRSSS